MSETKPVALDGFGEVVREGSDAGTRGTAAPTDFRLRGGRRNGRNRGGEWSWRNRWKWICWGLAKSGGRLEADSNGGAGGGSSGSEGPGWDRWRGGGLDDRKRRETYDPWLQFDAGESWRSG